MDATLAARFTSGAQRARVVTENWASANLYCASCDANQLRPTAPNTRAIDLECENCSAAFQLKSQGCPFGARVVDSAYSAMHSAVLSDHVPNLVLLHYDRLFWQIRNVLLIPSFGFTLAAIERRKPLSQTARRAGWIGCNIVLGAIPADLKIPLVAFGQVVNREAVRRQYQIASSLIRVEVSNRGWLIDVLRLARSLGNPEFSLDELYARDAELQRLHPENKHVRPKIRQQLQKLRDLGYLRFLERGKYEIAKLPTEKVIHP
jgi:type II restriction enzyme